MSFSSTPPDEPVAARLGPVPRTFESTAPDATRRGLFFSASAILYASIILLSVLALNPYFAQTWDIATFIHAAHRFLDGGNPFDLYAQSRAAQTWPYAYPPLHALATAIALATGGLVKILPDFLWARLPAVSADIATGIALYMIVERRSQDRTLARMALVIGLFNPLTFYDTAVQGHFESEWLFFVLVAYAWLQRKDKGTWVGTTVLLAVAVLFKQVAILFAIPAWIYLLASSTMQPDHDLLRRFARLDWTRVAVSVGVFGVIAGIVCLPYLLYSNDFLYMNLTYVENVPVQTQSWLVAVLGLTRSAGDALVSDFFLLRYQTLVSIIAAVAISLWGARRGWSLYLTATLIAIAFFLTSKKVMGYYYVMLWPFLLAEFVPKRRFDIIVLAWVLTTFIALSPYYASWTNHTHWWVYALLGTLDSILFCVLGWIMLRKHPLRDVSDWTALLVSIGLMAGSALAAMLQPIVASSASPIRAPLVGTGSEPTAWVALAILVAALLLGLVLVAQWVRSRGRAIEKWAFAIVLIFAPMFFAVYTLTKESTAILEMALHSWGVE